MSLNFKNQPLHEVALTVTCEDAFPLSADFMIELARHTNEDPNVVLVTGSEQIFPAPGSKTQYFPINRSSLGGQQLDGIKLVMKSGVHLYVQPDLIRASWGAISGQPYPRFSGLQNGIEDAQDLFAKINGARRPALVANLSYMNLIPIESPETILDYVQGDLLAPALASVEKFGVFEFAWSSGTIDQRITIARDASSGKIVFNSIAGMYIQEPMSFAEASESLNRQLNQMFDQMLTNLARSKWEQA